LIAFAVVGLWLVAAVSVARADTGDIIEPNTDPPNAANGWQAATCTTDTPECSPNAPNFFVEAGGHPPIGFTQYVIQHENSTGKIEPLGLEIPTSPIKPPPGDRDIKTLRVDLPPGLTVNPNATARCSLADFQNEVAPEVFEPFS